MLAKDSAAIAYSAEPELLTVGVLKNGAMSILQGLADLNIISLRKQAVKEDYVPIKIENLIKEIDSEFEDLELETYDKETQKSFSASAEQLKKLLTNASIKKTPDVVVFYKGYFGLIWDTKDDDSVYLYSMPGKKLFYNKVGENYSETRTVNADRKIFENLIKEINLMV
uniref:Uncharacterized protein n=1 Tax=uncultured bacterium contig00048 TaxID=1181533 RepID=A0A806K247_9BACT|nr:hypothetical protein [uncultured bacterium contig00048]